MKLDQERYGLFRILKDISQGVFQLAFSKGWMIHNVFNEDLLTYCKEPQFQGQHMDLALLLTIINEEEEYKVEEVRKHRKQEQKTQFLVQNRIASCKRSN